jgi:hypothetical protein
LKRRTTSPSPREERGEGEVIDRHRLNLNSSCSFVRAGASYSRWGKRASLGYAWIYLGNLLVLFLALAGFQ